MNQNLSEVGDNISEKFLADLRGMLWNYVGKNSDFAEIADKANVSRQTIDRLMWQSEGRSQTKRPHFETVVRLLKAMGREDHMAKVFAGDHRKIRYGRNAPD